MSAPENNDSYDRKTLITAACLFVGFCLLVFYAPTIMLMIGGENSYVAGAFVVGVIVLPFVGLWLRGRMKR
ncbi:MAG: hypothetical protein WA921_01590 [Ahrensia sp.]